MAADLQLVVKSADGTTETVRYKPGAKHAGRPATGYRLLVDGSEALPAGTRIVRRGRDLVLKADTTGSGEFTGPTFSYSILNGNVAGNLLGMSLTTLIEQQVILV